jgi:hypothetical protein
MSGSDREETCALCLQRAREKTNALVDVEGGNVQQVYAYFYGHRCALNRHVSCVESASQEVIPPHAAFHQLDALRKVRDAVIACSHLIFIRRSP